MKRSLGAESAKGTIQISTFFKNVSGNSSDSRLVNEKKTSSKKTKKSKKGDTPRGNLLISNLFNPFNSNKSLTDEQALVVNEKGNFICQAFAGTGKTSTLRTLAYRRHNSKIVYIVYNVSMREKAESEFPVERVVVSTFDKYARTLLSNSGVKIKTHPKMPKANEISEVFGIDNTKAEECLTAWNGWIISKDYSLDKFCKDSSLHEETAKNLERMWEESFENGWYNFRTIRKRCLDFTWNFDADVLLLDECQDLDPFMIEFARKISESKQVILMGDKYQSIYSFQGNISAFDHFSERNGFKMFKLTKTFRFGNEIIAKANQMLLKMGSNECIKRNDINSKLVLSNENWIKNKLQFTYLARSNRTLLLAAKEFVKLGLKVSWASGEYFLRKKRAFDRESKTTQTNLLGDKTSTANYTQHSKDNLDKLAKEQNFASAEWDNLLNLMSNDVRKHSEGGRSNVILSTIHSAKGIDWDRVEISSDLALYITKTNMNNKNELPSALYLYYVAITRCINELCDNVDINQCLDESGKFTPKKVTIHNVWKLPE